MTLNELLNKWGYSFAFTVTTSIIEYYEYVYNISAKELDRIKEFTEDVESYFSALINADITGSLNNGNLSPLKFRASVKEPINYQVGKELSNALKKFTDGGSYGPSSSLFSVNYTIEQLFENKDLWESYFKAERELKNQAATLDTVSINPDSTTASEPINLIDVAEKEIKTISIEPKGGQFIGRNTVSYSYTYNQTSKLYDYKITTQTNILLNSIKRYLEDQTVTALGVLKKKGETTIETIETPEIGNWKTVIEEGGSSTFIELKKDEIIQEMKDLMDPQVGNEYHSYSIQEVGNDIRVETTPFDKEPFDVEIEDIKLEE